MDLLIDQSTNALSLVNGDLILTSAGVQTVAQRLLLRLSLYLGEWFLNQSEGTPWREAILVRPVNLTDIRAILVARIASCEGVAALLELNLDLDRATRRLTFDFTASVEQGEPGFEDDTTINAEGIISLDDSELLCLVEMGGGYL